MVALRRVPARLRMPKKCAGSSLILEETRKRHHLLFRNWRSTRTRAGLSRPSNRTGLRLRRRVPSSKTSEPTAAPALRATSPRTLGRSVHSMCGTVSTQTAMIRCSGRSMVRPVPPPTRLTGSPTGTGSVYRRPLPAANLGFLSAIMWDGREPDLFTQAVDATLGHAQGLAAPAAEQQQQIVTFEGCTGADTPALCANTPV